MQAVAYLNTDVGECRQLEVPGVYSVGRASSSDFRPNTKSVSKNHARLELNVSPTTGKPEAWIEDFNSTFGTYVGVSPVALEKITERTRLFFGLYIRFGHAPQCYRYLEHPEVSILGAEPPGAAASVSNGSVQGDERSVTDTITSARRPRTDRVPLRIVASPTNEEVTMQLNRRPNNEESPRSKVQDLVDRFEPSRSPLQSPEAKSAPKKGSTNSSGNLSDTQIVMEMVTKIESTSPSHLAREPSFSFRSTPSPENSSKSHPAPSASPASSFHSKRTESYKDFAEQKALRVDTTSDYQWIESLPGPTAAGATAASAADSVGADTPAHEAETSTPSASVSTSTLGAAPLSSKDSSNKDRDSLFAPSKEADSGKELDYSIYDYDLDEKHGAGAQEVPSTAFRRNPSLWEDPALFDSLQQDKERESTSTRSMRTTPFNPMPSLQRNRSDRSATPSSDVPQQELSAKSQSSTLSDRDRAIALLAQRNIAITQARQVFRERKLAQLNPVPTAYPTFVSLTKQWERAVATVEAVEGGFCISVVLPYMRKIKIEACGRKKNKVRVEARRLVHQGDAVASDKSCEHVCEYKLQGLSNEIQAADLSHEYSAATGLLCVFVNRFKLQDPRLFVKERNLRGHANYVPQQPTRGGGMLQWLPLPGWMKEKKGRTERHNDQELRRAIKQSTADTTTASSGGSAPKTPRGSRSGAGASARPPRTPTSSSRAAAATGLGVTSPRAASAPKRPSSAKLSGPKDASGVTSPRAVRADKPAAAAPAPAVDRATLLRESIENGEVDGNVEFI